LILPAADSHPEELSIAAVFAFENRQLINEKFADFMTNIHYKMLKNGVDIEKFRFFVVALFRPRDCIPPLPTNLTKIFEAITHHGLWDSLHYSPLVRIVREFGAGDPEMKAWIENYKKDVRSYSLLTRIDDHIMSELVTCAATPAAKGAKYDPRYCHPVERITYLGDHILHYFTEVWGMLSGHFLLPDSPPTALLDYVRSGCGVYKEEVAKETTEVSSRYTLL